MDAPRIQAIDDVRVPVPAPLLEDVRRFYVELTGLEPVKVDSAGGGVILRGYPRSGPRLVLDPCEMPGGSPRCHSITILVGSLLQCQEYCLDRRLDHEWSRGWFHYERRLLVTDPAGHCVELIVSHSW